MPDLREALLAAARDCLRLLNAAVPKRDKVVLSGFPDGEDSIRELVRHLSEEGRVSTVLLVERHPGPACLGVIECRKNSIRGLWHYLTARWVFFTHGLYLSPRPPRSQVCINVWHGMPFKRVGHMIGRVPPHATRVIATSRLFRTLVAQAFGKPEDEVLVTGIPRNDVMVRAAGRADEVKRKAGIGSGPDLPRLVLWLPTFRQAVRGIVRTDGRAHASIFGMDDMDVEAFAALMRVRNCVCVIKPHPMAAETVDRFESDVVRFWRDADLAARGITLYELVGASDLLITDVSSVYVDYLILDKPVVIAFPDLEEYRATRGFALEPIEDYIAGPLAQAFGELKGAIEECFDRDPHAARRRKIAALFHDARDDQSTARLIAAVLPDEARRAPAEWREPGVARHCAERDQRGGD